MDGQLSDVAERKLVRRRRLQKVKLGRRVLKQIDRRQRVDGRLASGLDERKVDALCVKFEPAMQKNRQQAEHTLRIGSVCVPPDVIATLRMARKAEIRTLSSPVAHRSSMACERFRLSRRTTGSSAHLEVETSRLLVGQDVRNEASALVDGEL